MKCLWRHLLVYLSFGAVFGAVLIGGSSLSGLGSSDAETLSPDAIEHGIFQSSDGIDIHFMEAGAGFPVLLIHGYTGSAEGNWFSNGVAAALAANHRVIALDVRGHGKSGKPHQASSYGDRIWKDALELLDHLGIEKTHVHGYSMGGAITTQLLAAAPERFVTASYGGSGVRERDPSFVDQVPADIDGTDPLEVEARSTLQASPTRDETALGLVRDSWQQAFGADIDLTSIDIPVLAINGEFDRPNAKTHRLARELGHFESVVLPGKSHLTAIMAGYIPDRYSEALSEFLKRHTPVAGHPRVQEAVALLESWVDAELAYEQIPGASMAVVADQELVWARGFGHKDLESGAATEAETIYSICSISKLFTSVAALRLRDRGLLSLDDPLSKHLDWFEIDQAHPRSPPITLRGVLTHSSGLPRESDHPYWTGPEFDFPASEQIRDRVDDQRTLYPASRYFQYSNLGMTLLGETVAAVSGQSYDAYVRNEILVPLGMDDTSTEIPAAKAGGAMATGYGVRFRDAPREKVKLFQARGIAPAAGFASTVLDLASFASWQLRLLETDGREVLDANTLREMQRVQWMDPDWSTTWGLGFAVRRTKDRTYVGHGGSCPGFRSELSLDPASSVGAVFMSNAMGVNTRVFIERAHDILGGAIVEARNAPNGGEVLAPEFEKYLGLYRSYWGESEVIAWKGGLAVVNYPSSDPLRGLTALEHVEGDTFRRVRDDGPGTDELGEEWLFQLDDSGQVESLSQHGNFSRRIR